MMNLFSDGPQLSVAGGFVPDAPPLITLARCGVELHATAVHPDAADVIWLNRRRLCAIHGCRGLRLLVLSSAPADAIVLYWREPIRNLRRRC